MIELGEGGPALLPIVLIQHRAQGIHQRLPGVLFHLGDCRIQSGRPSNSDDAFQFREFHPLLRIHPGANRLQLLDRGKHASLAHLAAAQKFPRQLVRLQIPFIAGEEKTALARLGVHVSLEERQNFDPHSLRLSDFASCARLVLESLIREAIAHHQQYEQQRKAKAERVFHHGEKSLRAEP